MKPSNPALGSQTFLGYAVARDAMPLHSTIHKPASYSRCLHGKICIQS